MKRMQLLQEIRKMHFEEVLRIWTESALTQHEAARMLGVCARSFRRYLGRYRELGLEGLQDKRLTQASSRRAPVDEVVELVDRYQARHRGWNVKHFYSWYKQDGGGRSYTWVKNKLQEAGAVTRAPSKGAHRKRRQRALLPGMMLHQDGSRHEWIPGKKWDLIVTMDDATNKHYSMFFVEGEGTASSFRAIKEVILKQGLFCSLYTDRGSHYWTTPEEGAKVDKKNLTQFGRAMHQLGIEMIPAYSPEARGRGERAFRTHQDRLVKELALAGITTMEKANRYIQKRYLPRFNKEFTEPAAEGGSAFIPLLNAQIDEILCEQYERTVRRDNCIAFEGMTLQIPPDRYRASYFKTVVRVHRYPDGTMSIFHGTRNLAGYKPNGTIITPRKEKAA